MQAKFAVCLVVLLITGGIASMMGSPRQQETNNNPLAGGVWDRYSFVDEKNVESGSSGWYFLTFTSDGQFFITAVPSGRQQLSKPISQVSEDEFRSHFQGANVRRGTYTISGNGPFTLVLKDEVNLFSPNLQGSCPAAAHCRIEMENGEVRLTDPATGHHTKWRRVKAPQSH